MKGNYTVRSAFVVGSYSQSSGDMLYGLSYPS